MGSSRKEASEGLLITYLSQIAMSLGFFHRRRTCKSWLSTINFFNQSQKRLLSPLVRPLICWQSKAKSDFQPAIRGKG